MPYGVILQGADGKVFAANPAAAEILNVTREEMTGQPDVCSRWQAIREDGSPFSIEEWPGSLAIQSGQVANNVVIGLTQPGSPAVQWLRITAAPQVADPAAPPMAMLVFEDITRHKNADDLLQASLNTLKIFVTHAPAAIALLDRDMRYLAVSRRFLTDYNRAGQNLIGRSHYEVFPEIPPRWKEAHQRCLAGATETCEEDTYPRPDGGLDWVRWEIRPWYTGAGKVGGIFIFSELITERVQQQMALRQSEEKFTKAFYDSINPQLIASVPDGRFVEVNDSFLHLFEYSREQVIGRTSHELSLFSNPEQREDLLRQIESTGSLVDAYAALKTRTGKIIHGLFSSRLIQLNGEVHHLTSLIDVTARHEAEERLKETRQRLQLAIQAAHVGLWDWNLRTNEAYYSPEYMEMLGYEYGDFARGYADFDSLVHPDDLPLLNAKIQAHLANPNSIYWNEFRVRHRDGSYRWIFAQAELVRDEQGQPLRMLGSHIDITERKQAEAEIQLSNQLLELSIEPIFVWDVEQGIRFWNKGSQQLYGFSVEEARGRSPQDLLQTIHPQPVAQVLHQLETSGRWQGELRHVSKTGQEIIVESHQEMINLGGQRVVLESNRDITESRKAEWALTESRARYRGLIESIDSAVVEFDRDGTLLFVNEIGARRWKSTPEQLTGQKITDLQPGGDGAKRLAIIQQVIDTGSGVVVEEQSTLVDGSRWWFRNSIRPILDEAGQAIRAVLISTDITESKRAQQAIFESREDYRSLVESLDMMIMKVDRDGRYLFVNELVAKRQGLPAEAIIGKTVFDTLPPALAELQLAKVRKVIESGENYTEELRVSMKAGEVKWGRGRIQPVFDQEGKPFQAIITSFDISEIKQAQDRLEANAEQLRVMNLTLEKALQAKDQFMAAMSHELRTPLSGILATTESMLERVYGDLTAKQAQMLGRINLSGQRLSGLVNNVLDYTQLQSGQVRLDVRAFSAAEFCQVGVNSMRALAAEKHQELICQVLPKQLLLMCDEYQLLQAFMKLLDNAIKFTPEGGRIELSMSTDAEKQQARIAVRDNGIGIKAEDLPRLFQPFVQLDSRLSRMYEGAGLGLAIARMLVELHGGTITVESKPGHGSCFTILLPWQPAR